MANRKPFLLGLAFGLIALGNVIRSPRFETFAAVDVVQLIASGICFGIALMALLGRLKPRSKA
jgi:hypothetical protein